MEGWGEKADGRRVGRHPIRPLLAPSWKKVTPAADDRWPGPFDGLEPAPAGRVLLKTRHSRVSAGPDTPIAAASCGVGREDRSHGPAGRKRSQQHRLPLIRLPVRRTCSPNEASDMPTGTIWPSAMTDNQLRESRPRRPTLRLFERRIRCPGCEHPGSPQFASARYTISPPTMVSSTRASRISSSGTSRMSRDSTTISASLPGVIEPLTSSSVAAKAASIV